MINLAKIKLKKCQHHPPYFKKTCPCAVLPPPFLIFQIPPTPTWEVIKIYFPPIKKGGVRGLNYFVLMYLGK